MSGYSHILIAVDLTDDSAAVAHRGLEVARRFNARVSFLHVVEFIPVDPAGEALLPPPVDLEAELVEGARERLDALCVTLGLKTRRGGWRSAPSRPSCCGWRSRTRSISSCSAAMNAMGSPCCSVPRRSPYCTRRHATYWRCGWIRRLRGSAGFA